MTKKLVHITTENDAGRIDTYADLKRLAEDRVDVYLNSKLNE